MPRHSQERNTSLLISYVTALSVLLGISEKENRGSKYDHIQRLAFYCLKCPKRLVPNYYMPCLHGVLHLICRLLILAQCREALPAPASCHHHPLSCSRQAVLVQAAQTMGWVQKVPALGQEGHQGVFACRRGAEFLPLGRGLRRFN